jgi:isopenicillin N synthase-like dioxygenase
VAGVTGDISGSGPRTSRTGTARAISRPRGGGEGSASPDATTGADDDGRRRKRGGGDFKEGYDCGLEGERDNDDGDRDDARVGFFGRNLWPDEAGDPRMSGFREALLRYQADMIGLSDRLLLALGRSLRRDGVPEDYFVRRSRKPMCTLRLLHYPPAAVDGDGGGDGAAGSPMGCGAHTDYGLFTILQQDHIGGLQVRNRAGRWIDARPLRGSFVINVGDMLSRWTCGEYASTVHRVVSSRGRGGHRYSVPFFFNPDHDAVVGPLMGGAGRRPVGGGGEESADGDDAGGGGRTALEILADRYNGTFKKSQSKS